MPLNNHACEIFDAFKRTFSLEIFFIYFFYFVPIRSWIGPPDSQVELAKFHVVVYYLGEPRPLDGVGDQGRDDSEAEPDDRSVVHERVEFVAQLRLGPERVKAGVLFRFGRHL